MKEYYLEIGDWLLNESPMYTILEDDGLSLKELYESNSIESIKIRLDMLNLKIPMTWKWILHRNNLKKMWRGLHKLVEKKV